MNTISKVLIPNKEWLIKDGDSKIGSISKNKLGYLFHKNGHQVPFSTLTEVKIQLGIENLEETTKKFKVNSPAGDEKTIYDYPCSSKPFEPVYSVKEKLPLFAKSSKSKSQYCAGYYVIKFRKGWVKSFCPKLITLERYPYYGPFKTETEMKSMLNTVNKL
jgi:hypothetical protein